MSEFDLIGDDLILAGDDDDDDDEFEGSIGDVDYIEGDDVDYIEGDDDDDDDEELMEALAVEGEGNTEIIGARRRRRRVVRRRPRRRAARRRIAMRNSGYVRKVGLQSRRRNPLGFVPTSIGAGVTTQVPSAPQNLFRPERLVIPSDIAFDFGVADIKVGNVSQLVQSAELPAAIFSEVAIDTQVYFDTAEVGNQVSVQARNKSGAAIEFTAALLGTIAKR